MTPVGGEGFTLSALLLSVSPVAAGKETKVVWRMTGSGEPSISAAAADGTTVKPVWGPEPHLGSNWNRPGDEYGTGWVFPAQGCWRLTVKRGDKSGHMLLAVVAPR